MVEQASAADQRAFPRIPREIPIQILRPDYFCSEPIPARLKNISQNGALLVTTQPIPPEEWIVIRPDQKGAGFGDEISAIVDRHLSESTDSVTLACRFPEPLEYAVLRLFL